MGDILYELHFKFEPIMIMPFVMLIFGKYAYRNPYILHVCRMPSYGNIIVYIEEPEGSF